MSDDICSRTNFLPEEIVLEILLRVSPKSLIRFKSVCKKWCSMIYNPQFLAKNLLPARADGNLLLAKRVDNINGEHVFSLLSDHDLSHRSQSRPLPYPELHGSVWLVEIRVLSCNGLVCLFDDLNNVGEYIILWRPSDGEIKNLPPSDVPNPPEAPPGAKCSVLKIGFGYDSIADDYKVIRICTLSFDERMCGSKIEIYSLKTDTWKGIVVDDIDLIYLYVRGAYAKGVFSWLAMDQDRIVWFRMSDESFGTVMPPTDMKNIALRRDPLYSTKYVDYNPSWLTSLLYALNDQYFALVVYAGGKPSTERCFHVWVLLEFDVEESWTRLFTIVPWENIHKPIWFWRYDKFNMESDDGEFILCDLDANKLESLNISGETNNLGTLSEIISIGDKYTYY